MARLNEPPEAVESVESLKRRFIRQNRDLARSNSTQSLKIRALEAEVSRLLGENAALHEQVIALNTELESCKKPDVVDVAQLKKRLDDKLEEFNGLLTELGDLYRRPARRRSRISSGTQPHPAQTRRASCTLSEVPSTHDGRLPTIVEGKYYPRKTLESKDIQALLCEPASDSPDIGPPPRTFFDRDDAEHLEHDLSASKDGKEQVWNEHIPLVSSNFETRKRRRETYVRSQDTPELVVSSSPHKHGDVRKEQSPQRGQTMNAGAKRKLDMREIKDGQCPVPSEGFTFTRVVAIDRQESDSKAETSHTATTERKLQIRRDTQPSEGSKPEQIQSSPVRRALAPKAVNTDPVISPKKAAPVTNDNMKPAISDKPSSTQTTGKLRGRDQKLKPASVAILPDWNPEVNVAEIQLDPVKKELIVPKYLEFPCSDPKNPIQASPEADADPASSNVSMKLDESSTADGRVSRRARSNVSYAEPSLNSKMRRPTKDLVDAVSKEGKRSTGAHVFAYHASGAGGEERHSASVEPGFIQAKPEAEDTVVRTVIINRRHDRKSEEQELHEHAVNGNITQSKAVLPASNKDRDEVTRPQNRAVERLTGREGRRSVMHLTSGTEDNTAKTQFRASTSVSRSKHDSQAERNDNLAAVVETELEEAMRKFDIFDVKSSPVIDASQPDADEKTNVLRASSDDAANTEAAPASNVQVSRISSSHKSSRSSDRRQTLGNEVAKGMPVVQRKAADRKDVDAKNVRSVGSAGKTEDRAERVAARRRSMML